MSGTGTILIVEDHTMIAEYVASVLAGNGFEPVQAHSLAQARALLEQGRFDLWLCDLNLPDGSGIDLLAQRRDAHVGTPVIAMSAELDGAEQAKLRARGFDEVLAKPCPAPLLLRTIRRQLGRTGDGSPRNEASRHDVAVPPMLIEVLDDQAALDICGSGATVAAMRRLMAVELAALVPRLDGIWSTGNRAALGAELHKLAASAAWCGANQVRAESLALKTRLAAVGSVEEPDWQRLRNALDRLLDALSDPG